MKRWLVRILATIGGIAVASAIVGGLYFAVLVRGGFAARDQPSALEARIASAARSMAVPSRAKALRSPIAATAEVLADGRAHWADHCASCHANNGSGDTQIGRNLYPKVPDMRAAATQSLSDGELYYIIQNGIRLSGMPAWGERAVDDDKDSWALVAFIRHLPELSPDELKELQRLNPRSSDEWREEQEEEEFLRGHEKPAEPKSEGRGERNERRKAHG
ncbi:MAG TPA: cytochrome c [Kofleriaceae bacterium]|nr:cytochrome c [Kofleriaceae bacterium]